MRGNFDNTGRLIRFMLRRERLIAAVWIIILVLFSVGLAPGMDSMFPDEEARLQIASIYDNPIMTAMMGPAYGLDNYTPGAMYGGMMLLWVLIAVAVMNVFIVARHTRADEERWRAEVIRSLPVGRLANINAAMITALIINAVLAVLVGLGLAATQVEGMGFAGCMLYGALLGAGGLVFAGLTAVFCQISSSTGGAMGFSFLALGGFYMLRAAGDAQIPINNVISCISPLGLAQRSEVFVNNYILPLTLLLLQAVLITVLAYKLNSIRDLGQGFIPARPGRKDAKKSLLSPFGFSLRLLKGVIIVWVIVMFSLGASYGSVIGTIDRFVADSPDYLRIIGIPDEILDNMTDAEKSETIIMYFGVFITTMMSLIALVPVLIAAKKLRSEEKEGRVEHIISRSVPRIKYFAGFIGIAFVLSVLVQLSMALGLYSAAAAGENNPFVLDSLLKAYMVYLPAIWLIIGLAVLVVGLFPKAAGAIWGYYGFVCLIAFMGSMPGLFPDWLTKITPMTHTPKLPLDEISIMPLAVMTGIAAVLTMLGLVFYRRRDLLTH
jgi:ABC-2 type transport system permease protein